MGTTSEQLFYLFIPESLQIRMKRIGFEEPCLAIRGTENKLHLGAYHREHNYYEHGMIMFQQAFEWLTKNHGIQTFPDYIFNDGFHYGFKWVLPNGKYGETWEERHPECSGWDTPNEMDIARLTK